MHHNWILKHEEQRNDIMKVTKKIFTFIFLSVFVFAFVINITSTASSAADDDGGGGGSYCDEGKNKYCWTSLPNWECRTVTGGIKCVDAAVN